MAVSNSYLILYFLNALKILNYRRKNNMIYYTDKDLGYTINDESVRDVGSEFAKFFTEHNDFYDTPEKVTAFLVGVLSQKLINIQSKDRERAPFIKRLNGLKIREDILKRIFTEAKNKLLEYDKSYYKKLEALISRYSSDCGNFSSITNNELSFYFTSGMSLSGMFLKSEKNKEEENNQ
jgi:CRISPR-associated protein Csh1